MDFIIFTKQKKKTYWFCVTSIDLVYWFVINLSEYKQVILNVTILSVHVDTISNNGIYSYHVLGCYIYLYYSVA